MLGGKNKQHRQPLGYTIVEIMIVLAVSGFMFVIAASFINGKQEKTAFTEGSNDMVSKLQQTVEDVTDGHYSDVPLQCTASGGSLSASTAASGSQGQQSDCVFMGKILSFYDPAGGSQRDHYTVDSIAGERSDASFPDIPVTTITGLTAYSTVPQSLYVKDMHVKDAGGGDSDVFNVGFMQGPGNVDADTGSFLSGAQQPVQLVYSDGGIAKAKTATICLTDGTRYAEIFIGGSTDSRVSSSNNHNELNISAQQLGTTRC